MRREPLPGSAGKGLTGGFMHLPRALAALSVASCSLRPCHSWRRNPRSRSAAMTRFTIVAIVALITSTAHAQGLVPYYGPDGQVYYRGAPDPRYAPPGVPPDIIAPERPRGAPRPSNVAPPIAVAPREPLSPEPPPPMTPAPTAPIQSEPNPLIEWCKQEVNAKAPLCRNVGSPRVQR